MMGHVPAACCTLAQQAAGIISPRQEAMKVLVYGSINYGTPGHACMY
jgi:hypothetical protein